MQKFDTAAEVRKYLKTVGITKVKVRWMNNPFGGDGKFTVARTDLPEGSLISSSSSREPKTRWASDNPDKARMMGELQEALEGTNAFAVNPAR